MLASIQCLRGIAALMVVMLHVALFSQGMAEGVNVGLITLGNAGVDIFFVISGLGSGPIDARRAI